MRVLPLEQLPLVDVLPGPAPLHVLDIDLAVDVTDHKIGDVLDLAEPLTVFLVTLLQQEPRLTNEYFDDASIHHELKLAVPVSLGSAAKLDAVDRGDDVSHLAGLAGRLSAGQCPVLLDRHAHDTHPSLFGSAVA